MTPEYTDDGLTYLYTKCAIDADCVLNPGSTAYTAGNPPFATGGTLPAITVASIRHELNTPRRFLSFTDTDGGMAPATNTIVAAPGAIYTVDTCNGPFPRCTVIRELVGSKTFLMNFRVECRVRECFEETNPTALLSNRWAEYSDTDFQHMTRKTRIGIAYFRVDVLDKAAQVADVFRHKIVPPVSPGYQPVRVTIRVAPQRNALHYTFVHEEQWQDLGETSALLGGSGVVKIKGSFGVTSISTKEGIPGGSSMAMNDVTVYGNKYSNLWTLTQTCFRVILSKTSGGTWQPGFLPGLALANIGTIRSGAIRQNFTGKTVQVQLGILQNPPANVVAGMGGLRTDGLRVDPLFKPKGGVNPNLPNDNHSRGSAQELLLCAALEQACSNGA